MKRANGTGSVYKVKDKKRRKPYRAMMTVGYNCTGRPIRKNIGYFRTQQEAYDALANYVYDPLKISKDEITFAHCWDWMIKEKTRQGVDIQKGKFSSVKPKLEPIWNMPMKDIRLVHLQAIIDTYSHLSRSTHEAIAKSLNGAFREAIKNDIVSKNYAQSITLPSSKKSTIHRPFSEEEITKIWQHSNDKLARILLIYIYTGLRPIELYEIEIDKVNLKEQYMIGGVKTEAGRDRIIPIADCILPFVREIYGIARFKQSPTLIPKGYIQKRLDGPLKRFCEHLGISEHKRHDTRHTFITMARNIGMDIYILKSIVGHTHRGDVTSEVYTHKTISQYVYSVNELPVTFTEKMGATGVQPF